MPVVRTIKIMIGRTVFLGKDYVYVGHMELKRDRQNGQIFLGTPIAKAICQCKTEAQERKARERTLLETAVVQPVNDDFYRLLNLRRSISKRVKSPPQQYERKLKIETICALRIPHGGTCYLMRRYALTLRTLDQLQVVVKSIYSVVIIALHGRSQLVFCNLRLSPLHERNAQFYILITDFKLCTYKSLEEISDQMCIITDPRGVYEFGYKRVTRDSPNSRIVATLTQSVNTVETDCILQLEYMKKES
eukprot:TRINITY_DN14266_c0_g1_i1.p1 TRINITY_DN14266_c0_g1~~TRINITY_DN14266_c0_g1_i1.p1  ORF type:complete len:248 (-),score=-7.98 TRINITY_DN14266_c0_g1_i1:222-965(-)